MGLWDIDKIPYVGREKGPHEGLAFHYYDADKIVAGKKMKDWLRFGVAWWHTFDQQLVDPFGTGTAQRPWCGKYSDSEDEALAKVDYAFEFFQKLGVEYFCFHDRDIAPEGSSAFFTYSFVRFGLRCAELIITSYGTSNFFKTLMHSSITA